MCNKMSNNRDETRKPVLDLECQLLPADSCVLCGKSLQEIGGRRLVGQQLRGVSLSDRYLGGGNKDFPYQSFQLSDEPVVYLVVWGEKSKWTPTAIQAAKHEYLSGKRPWFCQRCGVRTCRQCGAPINYPVGSDMLDDQGCSSHAPIFPFDPGCSNPECERYKKWG